MSRVTLSASAALVLLLAACGGSSSGDGPSLEDQIENEIDDNDGVLDGQIITTPDGTRYVVDAIDPNAPGVSSGYLLVARLDSRGNPVVIETRHGDRRRLRAAEHDRDVHLFRKQRVLSQRRRRGLPALRGQFLPVA